MEPHLLVNKMAGSPSDEVLQLVVDRVDELDWAIPDHEKIRRLFQYCMTSGTGLALSAIKQGRTLGVLLVTGEELSWARKRHAYIHTFFVVDEETAKRLAESLQEWFLSKKNMLAMIYNFPLAQPEVEIALKEIGFAWEGTAFMLRRYSDGIPK